MDKRIIALIGVILLVALSILVVWPKGLNLFGHEIKMHLGLDLQGGVQLVYRIKTNELQGKIPEEAQRETVDLINRRINGLGVSEPLIQGTKVGNDYGVIVELPGINNIDEAKSVIGKTAQLKFYEYDSDNQEKETDLNGSDVIKAIANVAQGSNSTGFSGASPEIELTFTPEGAKKFKDITQRNLQKPIITKLDNEVINIATVQAVISDGKAVITGIKTLKEAKDTAQFINEGALPAPIEIVRENQIGAILGQGSVEKSLVAGLVGLILVAIFMIAYYRILGVFAVFALIIYTLLTLSIFKLVPVTLTLAGIAGFIFSIGSAVDANILVFERYKEEKKKGQSTKEAIENSFTRSWPSIRDSNISSLITAIILFYMSKGLVKGFALTLSIGLMVSMFTAITVTRTFLRVWAKGRA
ncbi:protein translocase subunit SecD [Candidatus Berkelbacteria bacterium CG10_big_fil_rev_8_21_14_0_10_41_12]|uniref:Protein translocase subunit SecD n=1 Tax=Candidatus Berkelbacteria bacterium CG10_big_fil_rev_8_21_14_0_10_41_12 TaxID=1974513 RepID=A0A2M6WWU1_9BACT|nr:MAG: protein translocase subunit SecD [Candidatus Berkelbacteria bacterium CG10_big_fil_rev_8_21_14_0_10_41_12]